MRTLVLFCAATLIVLVGIALVFITNVRQSQRQSIVLPDAAQSAQADQQPEPQQPELLQVSRENVQNIVRYLHRPAYYHQTYQITRQYSGVSYDTTAELWVSDRRLYAVLQTQSAQKYLLTDGQTLYVWYAGDTQARELPLTQQAGMDELIGLPRYEQLTALPAESIMDGEFISDDRYEEGQQIFAAAEQDRTRREFWIGLDSGLLTQSIVKQDGQTIYDALQTQLEVLAAGDAAFDRVFLLPDGTDPFAE